MDNAVEALKMAFAVIVFVIAISVSMRAFSQAKTTSDEVFYMADKTNFYEYTSDERIPDGRIVSIETIIPTLYRYYKENFNVIILDKNGQEICTFNLEKEIQNYNKNYKSAPWLGNANVDTKLRVDIEVTGEAQKINNVDYKPQIQGGLLAYAKGKKFKETFKEYRYSGKEVYLDENGELQYVNETTDEDSNGNYTIIDQEGIVTNGETLELVKGSTKIEITYQEVE